MKSFLFRLLFIALFLISSLFLIKIVFSPIFLSNNVVISYGIKEIYLSKEFPLQWSYIKFFYVIFHIISNIIIANSFYLTFFKHFSFSLKSNVSATTSSLNLYIGKNVLNKEKIFISETGLYQNILITGTIGTGKTSSSMYPFVKQLIQYEHLCNSKKIGMLILDVKGNFYKQVLKFAEEYYRKDDVVVIELSGKYKYNPLDKPLLKPTVLADRLKTVLTLFSKNNSDSYWLDKVAQVLTECIKLCRLYNNGYVTFSEIHKIINIPDYYFNKIQELRELFQNNKFNNSECFDLLSSIEFFETEFSNLDSRTLSIIKSEITRITSVFISDFETINTFCSSEKLLNFSGFSSLINEGKIVVLNMNISEYKNLSKIIATYLKLDFQSEVLSCLSKNGSLRTTAFVCDEFHEYVTSTDADFFAQSREAKCINIVATQSYTSLLNSLKDTSCVKAIVQNLINKLWFRTDDIFTIEDIQKQLGKEEKEKFSKSISENAKETNYNYLTKTLNSKNSSLSESINSYTQTDYIYDTSFFTSNLETFTCLAFLSDGNKVLPPCKLELTPYFKNERNVIFNEEIF